jgi:hypothetical protein
MEKDIGVSDIYEIMWKSFCEEDKKSFIDQETGESYLNLEDYNGEFDIECYEL